MIVITKDYTPQEVLSKLSAITPDPAKAIYESIKSTYEYEGTSTDYLLYDTLDMILNDKRGIVVASISIDTHEDESKNNTKKESKNSNSSKQSSEDMQSGSVSKSSNNNSSSEEASSNNFKVTELAYFKNRKFAGYLEKNDAIIYNLLKNRLKSSVLSVGNGENLITLEVNDAKANLNPKFENNKFVVDIGVKVKGNITECGNNVRENMNEKYTEYKKNIEDILKGKIEDAIDNYKYKYEEDIVGFEDLIYKKLNSEYKKKEDSFKEKYFENIVTNVNVEVKLPQQGGDMVDATK